MKKHFPYLILILLTFSCKPKSSKESITSKPIIESNDFWEYAEFLQNNPTTAYFKEAFSRYLFLKDSTRYSGVCAKNNLDISPENGDSVLLYGLIYPIDSIRRKCFQYLTITNFWKNYTSFQKEFVNPDNNEIKYYSRGRFDITVYGDTISYDNLQTTVIEVVKGINDYKRFLSNEWYNKAIENIDRQQKSTIDSIVGLRIDFFHFDENHKIPPLFEEMEYEIK